MSKQKQVRIILTLPAIRSQRHNLWQLLVDEPSGLEPLLISPLALYWGSLNSLFIEANQQETILDTHILSF